MLIGGLLAGCSQADTDTENSSPTPQNAAVVTPYVTSTPVIPPTATAQIAPTSTPTPLPTPTPYLYTVVADDTMIGIASYFGVTLDELMVANPEVSPNALSIGTQLIIPLTFDEDGEEQSAEAAAISLQTGEAFCYPVRSGGAWCYWPVTNPYDQPVENITGTIHLYDNQGTAIGSQAVMPLLNVLPAGESMPLVAYFPPPLAQWSEVEGELTSVVAANQYGSRYLNTNIEQLAVTPIDADGQGMTVSGVLRYAQANAESQAAPQAAWIVAVAYDADGTVVAARRWEAETPLPDGSLNFSFEIYSLGKAIDQVKLLAEVPTS